MILFVAQTFCLNTCTTLLTKSVSAEPTPFSAASLTKTPVKPYIIPAPNSASNSPFVRSFLSDWACFSYSRCCIEIEPPFPPVAHKSEWTNDVACSECECPSSFGGQLLSSTMNKYAQF